MTCDSVYYWRSNGDTVPNENDNSNKYPWDEIQGQIIIFLRTEIDSVIEYQLILDFHKLLNIFEMEIIELIICHKTINTFSKLVAIFLKLNILSVVLKNIPTSISLIVLVELRSFEVTHADTQYIMWSQTQTILIHWTQSNTPVISGACPCCHLADIKPSCRVHKKR